MKISRLLLLIVFFLLLAGGAGYVLLVIPAGPQSETFVEVAPGTSSRQIAAMLQQQGIIRSKYAFEAWRVTHPGTLKAGEYRFDHPAGIGEVYERIRRGDVFTRTLTIPEGWNIFDIAQAWEAAQMGKREVFLNAAERRVDLIADLDANAGSLEGYLFPDTYHFQRKTTADAALAAMVKRFRQEARKLGMEQGDHRLVVLASLVERETPAVNERALVAGVFENRLARGMPLDTDPSVIYAALLQGAYSGTIHRSDLDRDSAYNTYKHVGLPPGPICNPGEASLKAAMMPTKTDYLYFVVDPANAGHSRFAATLEEHTKNVQAYRRGLSGH